ncbi:hypothetical protein F751_3090 [Auxenochlorella protothecoides]|uniref:Uncharacterized protein n=1 Tax=Auxenochlorella protothecoides TaxID=3075 RepID=A0A087SF68_AUXPR|nr:hypothetical protein F751_3090 [Auxenochlorella protothecoides]KFM24372.1 hypothetical protein F751_3090 [Auxenochlorella protothecoides]
MKLRPDLTRWGKAVESFLAGYRIEHVVLALQMFICIIVAMLPVLTDRASGAGDGVLCAYRDLDEAATFWTVIAAAVVLEPCTGNVLRKFVVRMLAVGLATSMGVLVLYISFAICHTEPDQAPRNFPLFGHMVSIGLAFCAALIMLHRQRWAQEYEYAFFLSLLSLCVVTVPALRQTPGDALSDAGYRALNIVIGVAISAVVAFAIFPIKARSLLRKQTAVALMQAGDLAAWVFTQVGVEPTAKDSNALPHASGTDKSMRYIDDGLQVEMAPLFAATQRLAVSLAGLDDLLRSARAEVNLFSRPHRFPSKTYGALLSSLHTSVGLLQTQLYFMATGNFSLGAIRHHAGPICDAGVQLSIVFSALSRLSHQRRTWRQRLRALARPRESPRAAFQRFATLRRAAKNDEAEEEGLGWARPEDLDRVVGDHAASSRAAAHGAAGSAAGGGASGVARAVEDDDPFAGMDSDDPEEGGVASRIQMSPSQMQDMQARLQRLSLAEPGWGADDGAAQGPEVGVGGWAGARRASPAAPPGIDPAGSNSAAAGAAGTRPQPPPPSRDSSAGALAPLPARLLQLHHLSLGLLEAGQAPHDTLGAASLVQVAGCLLGLTRQGAAILAVLEPQSAGALHARMSHLRR